MYHIYTIETRNYQVLKIKMILPNNQHGNKLQCLEFQLSVVAICKSYLELNLTVDKPISLFLAMYTAEKKLTLDKIQC